MNNTSIDINFIKQLKQQILASRYIVAKIANAESLRLYFTIGKMVNNEINKQNWGSNVLEDVAKRLQEELPGLRGFSGKNIYKMRQFYNNWNKSEIIFSLLTRKLNNSLDSIRSLATDKLENSTKSPLNIYQIFLLFR